MVKGINLPIAESGGMGFEPRMIISWPPLEIHWARACCWAGAMRDQSGS